MICAGEHEANVTKVSRGALSTYDKRQQLISEPMNQYWYVGKYEITHQSRLLSDVPGHRPQEQRRRRPRAAQVPRRRPSRHKARARLRHLATCLRRDSDEDLINLIVYPYACCTALSRLGAFGQCHVFRCTSYGLLQTWHLCIRSCEVHAPHMMTCEYSTHHDAHHVRNSTKSTIESPYRKQPSKMVNLGL